MSGSFLDDGFAGHAKLRRVKTAYHGLLQPAADGILSRAISESGKQESDGFVDSVWFDAQLPSTPPRVRRELIEEMVRVHMLEPLPAGTTRELIGRPKKGLRDQGITVSVGPFDVDGFLVHDYLDCNRAAVEWESRREKERKKAGRRRSRPRLWTGKSETVSPGDTPVADDGDTPGIEGVSGLGTSSVPPETLNGDRSQSHAAAREHAAQVNRIVRIFAAMGVLIDEASVSNALSRFPNRDHEQVARGCAQDCRAHPEKDPGLTYHRWLEREPVRAGRTKDERAADDMAALERLTGRRLG